VKQTIPNAGGGRDDAKAHAKRTPEGEVR